VHSTAELDKTGTPRHDFGEVTRVLRFLALLTALFVVSVRCLSSFPLAAVCAAAGPDSAAERFCPLTDEPREDDTLAPVSMDDSDDAADAAIAPAPPRIRLLTHGAASAADCGALAAELALSSHARGLDRPPRV
jgi:hypothetical protein